MTYFSDFDYVEDYDDPMIRDRILRDAEEQYFEDDFESVPDDMLTDLLLLD